MSNSVPADPTETSWGTAGQGRLRRGAGLREMTEEWDWFLRSWDTCQTAVTGRDISG